MNGILPNNAWSYRSIKTRWRPDPAKTSPIRGEFMISGRRPHIRSPRTSSLRPVISGSTKRSNSSIKSASLRISPPVICSRWSTRCSNASLIEGAARAFRSCSPRLVGSPPYRLIACWIGLFFGFFSNAETIVSKKDS